MNLLNFGLSSKNNEMFADFIKRLAEECANSKITKISDIFINPAGDLLKSDQIDSTVYSEDGRDMFKIKSDIRYFEATDYAGIIKQISEYIATLNIDKPSIEPHNISVKFIIDKLYVAKVSTYYDLNT